METRVDEIGANVYRLSVFVPDVAPPAGFTYNHFLILGDEPLLFHCGRRKMYPLVSRAVAKISLRLVADQDPDEAMAQFKAAVKAATPKGVSVEVKPIHGAAPSLVEPTSPFIKASAEAMSQVFGKETVYIRSGGSIPIVGLFDQHLGIPSVLMGFGLPDDNLHAPNEKFHLPNFYRGIEAVSHYLELLGK